MVQGGVLTAHPGSVHGDGEAPSDESSLRQGAGTGSSGSPDLEMAVVAEQKGDREKGLCPQGFRVTVKIKAEGGKGWTSPPPPARRHPRSRHQGAWAPGGTPPVLLW